MARALREGRVWLMALGASVMAVVVVFGLLMLLPHGFLDRHEMLGEATFDGLFGLLDLGWVVAYWLFLCAGWGSAWSIIHGVPASFYPAGAILNTVWWFILIQAFRWWRRRRLSRR